MLRYLAKATVFGAACASGWPRARRHNAGNCLTIFTYHSFRAPGASVFPGSIPASRFAHQLRFLRRNFDVVTLTEGLRRLTLADAKHRTMAAITIDDGFADNYHVAWPLLREYRLPAAIFVATDFIDTGRLPWPNRVDAILAGTRLRLFEHPFTCAIDKPRSRCDAMRRLKAKWKSLPPRERDEVIKSFATQMKVTELGGRAALTWEQLREMRAGGTEIGSHTVFHSILPAVSQEVARREMADAKARIEDKLQAPCRYLAYPNGDHDIGTENAARDCGYAAAMTQDFGTNVAATPALALRRVEVPHDNPLPYFSVRASSAIASLSAVGVKA